MNDDGHSPDICNYRQCGNPDAEVPCPFVKERVEVEPAILSRVELECTHEWRQVILGGETKFPDDLVFYCIHCLQLKG